MKRLTTLLLLLCCLPFMAMAQDLNPGQQSQGLLESRNVTVDYSTGIFHYQMPLYTLKSGDYELPISLRYTGKGVKVSDKPGLVGYNWTLDTGGIVTRTVRGGIPDEKPLYGYLHFENDSIPLSEDATRVNRHKRDGECDIFTAVFGGKSVNFIIRKDGNGDLYAEPLERTDVKIECEGSRSFISGWTVTDNDGTRYNYMRTEWTCNLNKQDEISFNGLSNLEYVSSWHLTSIEPVNSEAITFNYLGVETNIPIKGGNRITNYIDSYLTHYDYGREIFKPIHDYQKFTHEFNNYIKSAEYYLKSYALQLEMEDMISKLDFNRTKEILKNEMEAYDDEEKEKIEEFLEMDWMDHPMHQEISQKIKFAHSVMGIISNFSSIKSISGDLINQLTTLSETFQEEAPSASHEFSLAKSAIEEYIAGNGVEFIPEKTTSTGISYKIVSPTLKSISCKEKILFDYHSLSNKLTNITKKTDTGNYISNYHLSNESSSLTSLKFMDKDSTIIHTTTFKYYETPDTIKSMSDVYGFHRRYSKSISHILDSWLEEDYSKILSLKKIILPDGGNIQLDYELNKYQHGNFEEQYGGVRIKSLILDNPEENRTDSISYSYEYGMLPYIVYPYNYEAEEYSSFTDIIQYSRMKHKSNMILRSGNNGLYYIQANEKIAGQGSRTYLFNITDADIQDASYPYWIWGLPTYTIEYDEDGIIKRVLQNLYYTDVNNGTYGSAFQECFIPNTAADYNQTRPQMMPNEKYMDIEDIAAEMKIPLNSTSSQPYIQAFWVNIASRVKSSYDTFCYNLRYGGATVLAEQREYRPLDCSYTEYAQLIDEVNPYNRTVYHYDHLDKHNRPTRIVRYNSDGDSIVIHQIALGDMMVTAGEGIDKMQEANIVSPIVKQAMTRNGILQEETVTEYETMQKENGCFYSPKNIYSLKINQTDAYTATTTGLFQGSVENYQLQKSMVNDTIQGERYLPIEITEEGIRTRFVFDKYYKRPLLQLKNINDQEAWALDCWHYAQISYYGVTDPIARIRELALPFMEGVLQINPEELNLDVYSTYCTEEGMQFMQTLLKNPEGIWMQQEINEAIQLLDTCATLYYFPIEEFLNIHIYLASDYLEEMGLPNPWAMSIDDMAELYFLVMEDLHSGEASLLRNYILSRNGMGDEIHFYAPQTLSVNLESSNLKLYLISTEGDAYIKYTITHNGGTTERTLELSDLTPGKVKDVSLDVNGYSGASGITVTGFSGVQYLAVVPEGTEFEATSYNEDGTVSLKFDPNGNMELYEYDQAGRPIRVRDENGKILKGNEYNKKSANL